MLNQAAIDAPGREGSLYDPSFDHDACGTGFIAQVSGKRSHQILRYGLQSLCHLTHRGALDADAKTGDGAGVMTQIPYKLFAPEVARLGHKLYKDRDLGVGVVFLPHDNAYAQARTKAITEEVLTKRGLFLFGWREVPIHLGVLGDKAQLDHAAHGAGADRQALGHERRRLRAPAFSRAQRNRKTRRRRPDQEFLHSVVFASRSIVYKGLLVSASLEKFYADLANRDYETAFCIYHQRYSTNTFPTWPLAQPFRMLAHNGEINTVRGNRNWMHAREAELRADFWGKDIDLLKPIIQPGGSDSASLDNALEVLVMSGRSLLHAITMLVPPAWRADKTISPELAAFYQYHACFNEPWDGPAALIFTDGRTVGACLDRNGLRPARYNLTEDGIFALGSEVGATGIDSAQIIEKGRLGPGEMIAVDTAPENCCATRRSRKRSRASARTGNGSRIICSGSRIPAGRAGGGTARGIRHPHAHATADRLWLLQRGARHGAQADVQGFRGGRRLHGRRHAAGRPLRCSRACSTPTSSSSSRRSPTRRSIPFAKSSSCRCPPSWAGGETFWRSRPIIATSWSRTRRS